MINPYIFVRVGGCRMVADWLPHGCRLVANIASLTKALWKTPKNRVAQLRLLLHFNKSV